VKDDAPSRTAAWVAAARQLAQLLPPEAQLVNDPYGAAFSYPRLRARIDRLKPLAETRVMKQWILYMQVRTRVIDDALRAWVAGGGRQLVLLGAGYDTRALRLPELGDVDVFEVDHPATQRHKQGVLAQLAVESPSRYVTWDFETRAMDDLPDVLEEAGLDRKRPVFTIWEGVTMYLTEVAIDASLRAIRAWSPRGSRLAMTYLTKSRLEQPTLATRAIKAIVATFGEPWRFGWVPDQLPAYLEARGFHLEQDISLASAARELLPPAYAALVAREGRHFSLAAPEAIGLVS
jgi:methyltransferase (TIGR00027 family)